MSGALPWLERFASQRGLRYEAETDERWLRAWEPYTTLRTPNRYEHALHATGGTGSVSFARAVVDPRATSTVGRALPRAGEVGTWLAIVQDIRISASAATTNDFSGVFGEPLELASWKRRPSGDPTFDHSFASFAETADELSRALTPSLRKLLVGWHTPLHAELRPGGFVLAAVALSANEQGIAWLVDAVQLFGDKATKLARYPSGPL